LCDDNKGALDEVNELIVDANHARFGGTRAQVEEFMKRRAAEQQQPRRPVVDP
jgi:hypothetical protein